MASICRFTATFVRSSNEFRYYRLTRLHNCRRDHDQGINSTSNLLFRPKVTDRPFNKNITHSISFDPSPSYLYQKALQSSTCVFVLSQPVLYQVYIHFFNRTINSGVIVISIFLTGTIRPEWKNYRYVPVCTSSQTLGSRFTNRAREFFFSCFSRQKTSETSRSHCRWLGHLASYHHIGYHVRYSRSPSRHFTLGTALDKKNRISGMSAYAVSGLVVSAFVIYLLFCTIKW